MNPSPNTHCQFAQLMALRFVARSHELWPKLSSSSPHVGQQVASCIGQGIDFAHVRAYQPGDDCRRIDWRVTARRQTVHTKHYHPERARHCILVLDLRAPMFFASDGQLKSILASQIACLMAWSAYQQGDHLTAFVLSNELIRLRQHHCQATITQLAQYCCKPLTDRKTLCSKLWLALEKQITAYPQQGVPVVTLISDFSDWQHAAFKRAIARLKQGTLLSLCHIRDPLEHDTLPLGYYPIRQQNTVQFLDLSTAKQHRAFHDYYQDKAYAIRRASTVPSWALFTHKDSVFTALKLAQCRQLK